jgi:hypothetical protein
VGVGDGQVDDHVGADLIDQRREIAAADGVELELGLARLGALEMSLSRVPLKFA